MLSLFLTAALLAAPPGPTPAPGRAELFALVVTSNRSVNPSRPPLQFADDDGAKYHEVFASLGSPERVLLLSELDEDTRGLFPHLASRAKPPTLGGLREAAATLARQVAQAKQAGKETELYFVFAGHGDVEGGRGFLELSDGRFDAAGLEALLKQVGAHRAHVILDSCNSFFVVNPRRPGGRRFATPADVTQGLAGKLGNVGVLLSTSAEAEVFEWSELQSGVFSHAVRSGLLGAADVDRDGRVSYAEMQGFIAVSTASVPNPLFRPKVYARGPSGDGGDTLWRLSSDAGLRLSLEGPEALRVSLRDAQGLRWLDAHKEAGATLELTVPPALGAGLELERWEVSREAGGQLRAQVVARASLPEPAAGARVRSGELSLGPVDRRGRGAHDVLRQLFAQPFGPQALAAEQAQRASAPAPVYGLAQEDQDRMHLLLSNLGDHLRESRRSTATVSLIGGGGLVSSGMFLLTSESETTRGAGLDLAAMGLVVAGSGLVNLLSQEPGERLAQEFQSRLAAGAEPLALVAEMDARLVQMVRTEREARRTQETAGLIIATMGAAVVYATEIHPRLNPQTDPLEPSGVRKVSTLIGAGAFAAGLSQVVEARLTKGPIERMVSLWNRDPGLREVPRLGLVPTGGGATLTLSGRF